jgi:GT2 family glycosyltransferase
VSAAEPAGAGAPRVSLIVVNYNTAAFTRALISGVTGGADEVIVVDNPSPGGAGIDATELPAGTVVLRPDHNLGYGAGANLGARRATGDVLVVANPDLSVTASGLRELALEAMVPGVALVAPKFVNPDGSLQRSAHRRDPGVLVTLQELCSPFGALMARLDPDWHATLLRSPEHDEPQQVHHVLGALMAIRASVFRDVGGFDEQFFLYREETDLCRRIRMAGWQVRHVPSVSAVHVGGGATGDTSPIASRPVALESHYRYLAKYDRPTVWWMTWLVGVLSSASWALLGRDFTAGRRALRWHLREGPKFRPARRRGSGPRPGVA